MKTQTCSFYSEGIKLEGLVQLPDDLKSSEQRAAVIVCSGGQGLKEWVPSRWWPHFLEAGYVVMAFDYRGFGTSEGERGQMFPQKEVEDVLAAVTFLQQHSNVDPKRIGVVGWGMGGGVVIEAAARDDAIQAVCCAAGFGWGARTTRDNAQLQAWIDRQDELAKDRTDRVTTGKSRLVHWEEMTPGRKRIERNSLFFKDLAELHRDPVEQLSLATIEAIYNFRPELVADRISPRPLLVVHGTEDALYHPDEAVSIYNRAKPPKDLIWIEGGDHLEWIHPDSPLSKPGIGKVVEWFKAKLPVHGKAAASVPMGMFGR